MTTLTQPNRVYRLFYWDFDVLDAASNRVAHWNYYCYAGFKDVAITLETYSKFRKIVARTDHSISFGLRDKVHLSKYFELLPHFFGYHLKIDPDELVSHIMKQNGYYIPLDMPVNVCYGSAALIRYLWEDPRIVYNFLTLRELYPDQDIGRVFLASHSQSLIPCGEINYGHSFVEWAYSRDILPKDEIDYPSSFDKDVRTPYETMYFVNNFRGVVGNWISKEMPVTNYIENPEDRIAHAGNLLMAYSNSEKKAA